MRTLGLWLLLSLAACATIESPPPLTGADIVFLAKSGKTAPQIIEELRRTDTVLFLQASEMVGLHDAGVPAEVLDYLQRAQIEEIRRRDRQQQLMYWGPLHGGFGNFPWGPTRR
jgi:hypothetical protein